jgi:hypothetical protein
MTERLEPPPVRCRHTVAGHSQKLARRHIAQHQTRRRQLRQRLDPFARDDLSAERAKVRRQRVGDTLRTAARDRPTDGVRGDDQAQPVPGGREEIERHHAVRRGAGEQGPCAIRREAGPRKAVGRTDRFEPERRPQPRVARPQRPEEHLHQRRRIGHERRHQPAIRAAVRRAEAVRGRVDRTLGEDGGAVGEWMRERRVGVGRREPMLRKRQRLQNGEASVSETTVAHVVDEPGTVSCAERSPPPTSAAPHARTDVRARQRDGGREPVRAGSDDEGVGHRLNGIPAQWNPRLIRRNCV